MDPSQTESLLHAPKRVLSTLEQDGSRRWLYPGLAKGRFWSARRAVAYGLIGIFTLIPYLHIGGHPAVLLDIVHRRFHLFGLTLLPTDTALLALFLLSLLLAIFTGTALLGRIWCGWACPQTVYMEFVFRPIERLFGGRSGVGGKPANSSALGTILTYAASLLVCVYLAHTFLAYFVGVEQLRVWVRQSPVDHPVAFLVMMATTGLMIFDFLRFREQTCIIACPYGRLQSVLLDRASLVVSYDVQRGEPRGKIGKIHRSLPIVEGISRNAAAKEAKQGDCVDCSLCVQVCPTGIDIRDGLQVECVACTQCIDACDAVMDKIDRPRGLIRYTSQAALAGQKSRLLRPRSVIYSTLFLGLASLLAFLILHRAPADVVLIRQAGATFLPTADGQIENIVDLRITNRRDRTDDYRISLPDQPALSVRTTDEHLQLGPGESLMEPIHILAPESAFQNGMLSIRVRVTTSDGRNIDNSFRILGPLGVRAAHKEEDSQDGEHKGEEPDKKETPH